MAGDYTPSTRDVRSVYGGPYGAGTERVHPERLSEFDRWLTQHDAEVRRDGHREGYKTARQDLISGAFVSGPTYEALRDSFTGQQVAKEVRKQVAEEIAVEVESNVDWSNGRYDYGDNEGYEHAARIAREIGGGS